MTTTAPSSPAIKTAQFVLQALVAGVFLVAGLLNLAGVMTEELLRLGYPAYFATIIGIAYIIGVACLYQPRLVFLQDWAFGAMAATLVGAAGSHILVSDPLSKAAPPIVTLVVLLVAYALRRPIREN